MTRRRLRGGLLWVVDRAAIEGGVLEPALAAGVDWVQLRDEGLAAREWVQHFATWPSPGRVLDVVVNGGPAWAHHEGWGAHLKAAQPVLDVTERARWGFLGRSVHDPTETQRALLDDPDYLVAGPVYPTSSKPGHAGIGERGLAAIVEAAGTRPVLAIGGLTPDRIAAVAAAGAAGIAVRSGITAAACPADVVAVYRESLERVFLPAHTG